MKKFVFLITIFMVMLFSLVQDVFAKDILRVPINNIRPYAYYGEDGLAKGVAIDIIEYIKSKHDLEVRYVPSISKHIDSEDFEQYDFDIIPSVNPNTQNSQWLDFTKHYIYAKFFKLHFRQMELDEYIDMSHKTIALVSGGEGADIFQDWADSVDTYCTPRYYHDYVDCHKSFRNQESTSMLLESLYDNDEELMNFKQHSVIIISTSHPRIGFRKSLDPSIKKTFDAELKFLHGTAEGNKILKDIFSKYYQFSTYKQDLSTVFYNCFLFFILMVLSQAIRLFENYGMRYSSITWGIVFSFMAIMLFTFGIDVNSGYLFDLIKVLICVVTLFFGFFAGLIVLVVCIIGEFYTFDNMFGIPVIITIISYIATLLLRKESLKSAGLVKSNSQLHVSNKSLLVLLLIMIVTSIVNVYAQGILRNVVFANRIIFLSFTLFVFTTFLICFFLNEVISKGRMTESLVKNVSMLRTLLCSIGDGVIAVDTKSRILFVNKVALKLLCWSEDDPIGLDIEEVFVVVNSQTNERLPIPVGQVLLTKQIVQQEYESVLISKDNKRYYISYVVTPIVGKSKELPAGVVVVFRDITEKLEASVKLKEQEQLFNEAKRLETLGRLAGGVAHDFNNILQIIMGFSELIEDVVDDGVKEMLSFINSSTYRGKRLVKELMLFSCKERANMYIVNLSALIKRLSEYINKLLPDNINLEVNVDEGIYVSGDESMLEQAITNICMNSKDAICENQGNITIDVFRETLIEKRAKLEPGKYVVIKVSDDGCGMSQELMSEIFVPFFTTKDIGSGTGGMGLSSVFGIVEQHKGDIFVESDEGDGSIFCIYLPVSVAKSSSRNDSIVVANKPKVHVEDDQCILVVEDDKEIRSLMVKILESSDYKVLSAVDGQEGVDLFVKYADKIILVVSDVELPNMNGKRMYEQIKSKRESMPIIFCSGYNLDRLGEELLSAGNVILLQKPFAAKLFLEKVTESLSENN